MSTERRSEDAPTPPEVPQPPPASPQHGGSRITPLRRIAAGLRSASPEVRVQALNRLWERWERGDSRPLMRSVVRAACDEHDAVSYYAVQMLDRFSPGPVAERVDLLRGIASADRQVRLRSAQELLTILHASRKSSTESGIAGSTTEGAVAQVQQTAQPAAGTGKQSPSTSLLVAAVLSVAALACVGLGLTTSARPAAFAAATVFAVAAYAFFTRWLQRVDRSRSRVLQFLERVRCYIAHEDPATDPRQA